MSVACIVDIVRHGETEAGPQRLIGSTDVALSARGWVQMWEVAHPWLDGVRPSWVITSPLRRCAAFAGAFARRLGVPLVCDAAWREMHFGQWEMADVRSLSGQQEFRRLYASPEQVTPPQGEAFATFAQRVVAAWQMLASHQARHVVLFTHGGVMRVLLCHALGLGFSQVSAFFLPYGAHVRLRSRNGHGELLAMNPVA